MRPLIVCLLVLCAACSSSSNTAAAKPPAEKHYTLTGKVVSLDAKQQMASVDAAAIPNFMDAMTMDYPIKSKVEFDSLHAGDKITATVDVNDDGSYSLSNVKVQPPAKK